eukprot:3350030-Amphidinium_carterae.1
MVANQREGCIGRYLAVPRQLAREVVGMNKEDAGFSDVHFGQVPFQSILPQTEKAHRSRMRDGAFMKHSVYLGFCDRAHVILTATVKHSTRR